MSHHVSSYKGTSLELTIDVTILIILALLTQDLPWSTWNGFSENDAYGCRAILWSYLCVCVCVCVWQFIFTLAPKAHKKVIMEQSEEVQRGGRRAEIMIETGSCGRDRGWKEWLYQGVPTLRVTSNLLLWSEQMILPDTSGERERERERERQRERRRERDSRTACALCWMIKRNPWADRSASQPFDLMVKASVWGFRQNNNTALARSRF